MGKVRTVLGSSALRVAALRQPMVNRVSRPPMSALHPLLAAAAEAAHAVPIRIVSAGQTLEGQTLDGVRQAAGPALNGFEGKAGQLLVVAGADGAAAEVLLGAGQAFDPDDRAGPVGAAAGRPVPAGSGGRGGASGGFGLPVGGLCVRPLQGPAGPRAGSGWSRPRGWTRPRPRASPPPAPWRAKWSTPPPPTWGRCRSRPSPARSPRAPER